MSFKYKLNPKVVGVRHSTGTDTQGLLNINPTELTNVKSEIVPNPNNNIRNQHGVHNLFTQGASELINYPVFALPKPTVKPPKKSSSIDVRNSAGSNLVTIQEDIPDGKSELDTIREETTNLKIRVVLDFGVFFGWLERALWLTMSVGILWALFIDFSKATTEMCTKGALVEEFPMNVLPSLSRTMSSFRVGTFFWTITIALAFVARLASNTFLHKLYESWYEGSWWNKVFLGISYYADNLEILSLLMIPAFSLDCDENAHRFFFILFLALTYTAEILQYSTKFLRRKKDVVFNEDVKIYYTHIGVLILFQTFFIGWMVIGYFLHEYICTHFLYSIFTFGEYMTVVINIRFKRDTVIFVK